MLFSKEKVNDIFTYISGKVKKFFRKFRKFTKIIGKKYPIFVQFLQLSLLYAYATIALVFLVQTSLGMFPERVEMMFPFVRTILSFPPFRILASPEKTLLLYIIISEIVLNREKASLLFQYNFILVFILEMIEGITIGVWDIFGRRDPMGIAPEDLLFAKQIEIGFFSGFFYIFFFLYMYSYIQGIFLKFVCFPKPFEEITDSVAFWLRIDRRKRKKRK